MKYVHLIISLLLLLPVSIMLENHDGLDTVNNFSEYLKEWIPPLIISTIISLIFYGVTFLFKKKSSFIIILYTISYSLSIIILLILGLKYV